MLLCLAEKGAYAKLKHIRELQKKLIPTPDRAEELALSWEIRKELQDAGVLSAHNREDPGTVISEGR